MKNKILILITLFFVLTISCKTKPKAVTKSSPKIVENIALQPPCALPLVPEYPDGNEAMNTFISDHLKYPEEAKKNNISGPVLISFLVLVSGELTDVKVQEGIGYGCDEEAIRIVKLMPKWKPGKYLNTPIDMSYSMAIIFQNK